MISTYTIKSYKPGTAYVAKGSLDCDCEIAPRMDGTVGLTQSGNLFVTDETVVAAIMETIKDGQPRTVEIGTANAPLPSDDDAVTRAMTMDGRTF